MHGNRAPTETERLSRVPRKPMGRELSPVLAGAECGVQVYMSSLSSQEALGGGRGTAPRFPSLVHESNGTVSVNCGAQCLTEQVRRAQFPFTEPLPRGGPGDAETEDTVPLDGDSLSLCLRWCCSACRRWGTTSQDVGHRDWKGTGCYWHPGAEARADVDGPTGPRAAPVSEPLRLRTRRRHR